MTKRYVVIIEDRFDAFSPKVLRTEFRASLQKIELIVPKNQAPDTEAARLRNLVIAETVGNWLWEGGN